MNGPSRPPVLAAIALLAILATLLVGCGSDGDSGTASTQATVTSPPAAPSTEKKEGSSAKRKPAEKPAPKRAVATETKDKEPRAVPAKKNGQGNLPAPSTQAPTDNDPPQQAATGAGACPAQLSARQCNEAKAVVQQGKGKGQPLPAGQCPPGVNKETCGEISESASGAPPPAATAAPSCPPALTAEQCRELEAAR